MRISFNRVCAYISNALILYVVYEFGGPHIALAVLATGLLISAVFLTRSRRQRRKVNR